MSSSRDSAEPWSTPLTTWNSRRWWISDITCELSEIWHGYPFFLQCVVYFFRHNPCCFPLYIRRASSCSRSTGCVTLRMSASPLCTLTWPRSPTTSRNERRPTVPSPSPLPGRILGCVLFYSVCSNCWAQYLLIFELSCSGFEIDYTSRQYILLRILNTYTTPLFSSWSDSRLGGMQRASSWVSSPAGAVPLRWRFKRPRQRCALQAPSPRSSPSSSRKCWNMWENWAVALDLIFLFTWVLFVGCL